MSSASPKHRLLEQFAVIARALGHAHRLELLELLAQRERSVDELARLGGLTFGNASQHLQQLRRAGLVAARRQSQRILYRLSDDTVLDLVASLYQVAERNVAEVDNIVRDYFQGRDGLEPVSVPALLQRMSEGVVILDVRPADEFAEGHLPGALNIPLAELPQRLTELPADDEVIAYCRGRYCLLSVQAVDLLQSHGVPARRLAEGLPEWRRAGLPVERANAERPIP